MFRNRLTPPSLPIFILSLVLVILAVGSLYTTIPYIGHYITPRRLWVVVAAYALLAAGVLFRRL